MSENLSILAGERSFFGDNNSFNANNLGENSNNKLSKEYSINSSNPEKIYDKLENEIKKFTENKDSSFNSNNYNNNNNSNTKLENFNEKLYNTKYWVYNKNYNQESQEKFQKNFEKIKKYKNKKLTNSIPYNQNHNINIINNHNNNNHNNNINNNNTNNNNINNNTNNNIKNNEINKNQPNKIKLEDIDDFNLSDIDEFDSFEETNNDENEICKTVGNVNKVNCINIQSNNLNSTSNSSFYNNNNINNNKESRIKCVTEPDEIFSKNNKYNYFDNIQFYNKNNDFSYNNNNYFLQYGSFISNNLSSYKRESFISTNYGSNNKINTNNNVGINSGKKSNFYNNEDFEMEINENNNNNNTISNFNDYKNYINDFNRIKITNNTNNNGNNNSTNNNNLIINQNNQQQQQNVIENSSPKLLNNNNTNNTTEPQKKFPLINLNFIYATEENPNNNPLSPNIQTIPSLSTTNKSNNNNTNNTNNNNNSSPQHFYKPLTPTNNNNLQKYNNIKHENNNKGEKQLINLDDIISGKDTRTTIMIRNIPIKYSDKMLIKELEEFKDKFDCIYMPYDQEKCGNKGYAFINFIHPYHILFFYEKFQNKTWTFFESKKICELNNANFQGISEIQKHAKNYKGIKKPTFFKGLDNMKNIEVPLKYLKKIKIRYPKLNYIEKKEKNVFLIKAF
jgi:CCR4-NOT transcription complex subunit 7/8